MKILAIDPSSNQYEASTTGVVLLNNAQLLDYWIVPYGVKNFKNWFKDIGQGIEADQVIVEEYDARDSDRARDNSTKETMLAILECYPNAITRNNAGYRSDVPDDLLKALDLWEFGPDHHQDVRAATRLGLFWAMRNDVQEVVQDIGQKVMFFLEQEDLYE